MDFLLDPNVAYLILLAGIFLSFLALAIPGTGVAEIGAVFCFVLAGYAAYNLSIHWWALIVLLLSIVPFVLAVRNPKSWLYLGMSILLLVVGSVFLFANEDGLISVNPVFAIVSSSLVAVSLWFMLRKSIEAIAHRPAHDLGALVGRLGEAKSEIRDDGSVYVAGEMWSARSGERIPEGSQVRVVNREGFVLVVEKVDSPNS